MPNAIRYFLWSILFLGMLFLAIMAFWVFLILLGIGIIARIIYMKLFNKGAITIHRYTMKQEPRQDYSHHTPNDQFTTVIDADDMEQEYKIPKIK